MTHEWNKPTPTYELSSNLEQPPAGKIAETRTVYSVSDVQDAAREGTPTLTDSDGNDLYPPAVCNWIVWSEERIIALERDLASATAALAEERARADESARLHVSASENAHMHYKNSVHWKRRADLAESERDALALAIQEWQGKAEDECSKNERLATDEGDHSASEAHSIDADAIHSLNPPSRERGEALLRELEAAKDALQEFGDNCIRDAKVIEAAHALVPLLVEGWDEYDSGEDREAGSAAVDALIKAVQERDSAIKEGGGMSPLERTKLIDQLDRSFQMMPRWAKIACKFSMGAPQKHPETGKLFTSFREVIEAADDATLEILRDDFFDNGDLLPTVPRQ